MNTLEQMTTAELRSYAQSLGISVTNMMSSKKLIEKINEHMKAIEEDTVDVITEEKVIKAKEIKAKNRTVEDDVKEATRLVRVVITNNNPEKNEWKGEIFTVQNAIIPKITKYVPYGVTWHVPVIMLNAIKERKYRKSVTTKNANGVPLKRQVLLPEFTVQLLDPITTEEFEAIKQRQLANEIYE